MAFIALLVHCGWYEKTKVDLLQLWVSEYVSNVMGYIMILMALSCVTTSHIHSVNLQLWLLENRHIYQSFIFFSV